MSMKKRARGGAFGGTKTAETNGKQDGGPSPIKLNPEAKVMKVATKTSNSGFAAGGGVDKGRKDGGAIGGGAPAGNLAKRARGGSVFSGAGQTSDRCAGSDSGHEGE